MSVEIETDKEMNNVRETELGMQMRKETEEVEKGATGENMVRSTSVSL